MIRILYEDNHIIVVVKPENIPAQLDISGDIDMLTLVKSYIKEKYNKPGNVYVGLVHRLDRPTSGIMVFAKTSKAAKRLSEAIRNNLFHKKYLAVVDGILKNKTGIFKDKLKREENGNSIVSDDGKDATLEYTVIAERNNKSLVSVNLMTGRHHQIRVQFASRGLPLCGDQRYNKQDKTQLALHAYEIEFPHPTKNEVMKFIDLPNLYGHFKDFEKDIKNLQIIH